MADLKDTQFYDLREVEEPKKPSKVSFVSKNKKSLIRLSIILSVVIVIAVVVVAVLNRQAGIRAAQNQIMSSASDSMARDLADCAEEDDVALCQSRVRKNKAREAGQVSVCQGMDDQQYKNCVELIAFDGMSLDACDALENGDVTTCKDQVNLLLSIQSADYASCANIKSTELKASCESQILPFIIADNTCKEMGVDPSLCDQSTIIADLLDQNFPQGCDDLEEEVRYQECVEAFSARDIDDDGLNDWEEVVDYGTDYTNPDTDGDSFLDGDEVANGFDPLN